VRFFDSRKGLFHFFLAISRVLVQVIGDLTRAAQLALRAAWACDDDRLDVPAAICRAKAATIFERVWTR